MSARGLSARTVLHVAMWLAAACAGIAAVLYARAVTRLQAVYFGAFDAHPIAVSLATPVLFVLAAWFVHRFSIAARGSGIPQVIEAIALARNDGEGGRIWTHSLVSIRTALVKVTSTLVGILGGASIGREGPTVQIATSLFALIGDRARRVNPSADFSLFATAGAAAGVAAAFNTPLAGITFALEEIAEEAFGAFKQLVIMSVVIAGITSQALAGDYLYFGRFMLAQPALPGVLLEAVPIALAGGLAGGVFARLLAHGHRLPLPSAWWLRAALLGALCSVIGLATAGHTAGSGYEITRRALDASQETTFSAWFPVWKLVTTVSSYLSGMAGGIFSPSLTIGAGIGLSVAHIAHFSALKVCALMGMVAFFSGAIQAPLTGVVIVMEMTNQHMLILGFMLVAFLAQAVGRRVMPVPLYRYLATRHRIG